MKEEGKGVGQSGAQCPLNIPYITSHGTRDYGAPYLGIKNHIPVYQAGRI